MPEIDEFSSLLLEEAKRFLEKAIESKNTEERVACLHAALMISFCSLEAHINSIADDFGVRRDLTPADIAVLQEKELRLENGEYFAKGFKMFRMEDRILFLFRRFSSTTGVRSTAWWSELSRAVQLRNDLTHPKQVSDVTGDRVKSAILAIVSTLNALYESLYGRPFPAAVRGLQSRLDF